MRKDQFATLLHEAKRLYPLEEVCRLYGMDLKRSGRTLVATCPFHPDRRPSFHIYPDGHACCYGCGWWGDVVDFVAAKEGVSLAEAVALLLRGMTAQEREGTEGGSREERELTERELAAVEAAYRFYRASLGEHACSYLASRGIPPEAARRLGVGYGHPGLARALELRGLLAEGVELGLLRPGRHGALWEPFRGRIVIADLDREGRARWLTGRATGDAREPRYLNIRGPKPLLGLDQVEGDTVALVEGPLDWVAARAMGLPAVATLGTQVSRLRLTRLARFRCILLCLDADEAGREATRLLEQALGARAAAVPLPEGAKDVADVLRLPPEKRQAFLAAIEEMRRRWTR